MNISAIQLAFFILIGIGAIVSVAGIFIIRYYAKRPINGEAKTIKKHQLKIEETEKVISRFEQRFHSKQSHGIINIG